VPPQATASREPKAAASPVPALECTVALEGRFHTIWANEPDLQAALGCPSSHHPDIRPDAREVETAYQPFQHGEMIWSSQMGWYPQPVIYALYGDGTYDQLEDTYDPAVDSANGDEEPPVGLVEPQFGFGKVWRNYPDLRARLGWATAAEQLGSGRFQMFLHGEMIWLSQTGQTYVFVPGEVRVFDLP